MDIEKIKLDEKRNLSLTAYCLDRSPEFSADLKRPAVLICPGGGYIMTSDREAEPVAQRFLAKGYNAFVLRYSTSTTGQAKMPAPLLDAAMAMAMIKERKEQFGIDPDKTAVCGFSAGGNLAGLLATRWHDPILSNTLKKESELFRPSLLIASYGMMDYPGLMKEAKDDPEGEKQNPWGSKMDLWRKCNQTIFGTEEPTQTQMEECSPVHQVSEKTPPSFIWHTAEDDLVYVSNSLNFASALSRHKVPYELHVYERGGHGLSLADETSSNAEWQINSRCSEWINLCTDWMEMHFRKE